MNEESVRLSDIAFSVDTNGGEAPPAIVYLPEGDHVIECRINGEPGKMAVHVDASCLKAFKDDLQRELERNVKPAVFFRHDPSGPRAYRPIDFDYKDGVGLLLLGSWTRSGKESSEGGDFTHFSPRCLFSRDGTPLGLMPKCVEIGSLVNDPAFEEIPHIAAEKTPVTEEEQLQPSENSEELKAAECAAIKQQKTNKMEEYELLVKLGLLTKEDAEKENAFMIAASKLQGIQDKAAKADSLTVELSAAKVKAEALDALKEQLVESKIASCIEAGKIAPQDEDAKGNWKKMLSADFVTASKAIDSLPVNPAFTEVIAGKETKEKQDEATGLDRIANFFKTSK